MIKSATASIVFPSICHEVMGSDDMILSFLNVELKPTFSLSSFHSIKRLFTSSSLSAIRVVSSAYLRLLIFLPVILIPVCASFDCVDHKKLWKILKKMGIADHLTCLQRNLYADQEATVRTGHGTTDWFQIGKGVRQGYMLSPCLFNLYAEAQAGTKTARGKYQ